MTTFVFLGPSLSLNEAKEILPHAHFLPPAACGDIVKIMCLAPRIIVLIDGFFENRPSVWHKEILYALNQGVLVYGASSMGALRASELADFGMIGVGAIYDRYQSGDIIDDDEVTLTHLPEVAAFKPYTFPMVNIRFTIEKASKIGIITASAAESLTSIAKQIFYQERTLGVLKAEASHLGLESFFRWFESGGYVDQKRIDAIKVLEMVSQNKSEVIKKISFSNTALFRNLKTESLSKPFDFFHDWLPLDEKIGVLTKLFGVEYLLSKQLAKAIGVAYDCGFISIVEQELSFKNPLVDESLVERILNYFLKFSVSGYSSEIKASSLKMLSRILANLYEKLGPYFEIEQTDEKAVFEEAQHFYARHKINTKEDFELWLQKKEMTLGEFKSAMQILYFYDFFIGRNNLSTLYKSHAKGDRSYFTIAISLNKLDQKILEAIQTEKREFINRVKNYSAKGDEYGSVDPSDIKEFINTISSSDINSLSACSLTSWQWQ